MCKKTPTILVTGFGPFPGTPQNPSETLIKAMASRPEPDDVRRVFGVLPTNWKTLEHALKTLIAQHKPDIAVHLGYSANSPGFQLESSAYNETCVSKDVAGQKASCEWISPASPQKLKTALALDPLQSRLAASGIATATSDNPGRYLCNMAYYHSLLALQQSSLFIHIPALLTDAGLVPPGHHTNGRLTINEAIDGLDIVLKTLKKT